MITKLYKFFFESVRIQIENIQKKRRINHKKTIYIYIISNIEMNKQDRNRIEILIYKEKHSYLID